MVINPVHVTLGFRLFRFGGRLGSGGLRLLARRALGVPPLGADLDALLLQLFNSGMYGRGQIRVGANAHQLVVMVIHRDLGLMQMPFQRQDHVRFFLLAPIE